MADDSAVLLDLGFNTTPFKDAARVVSATMADLARMTSGVEANAVQAAQAQKPALEDVRATSAAAVKAALEALLNQQKLTEGYVRQSAQIQSQVESLKTQTTELFKQLQVQEQIRGKLAEQVAELRKGRIEQRGETGGERGFGTKLSEAVLGTSVGGKVGTALITGAGIGALIEAGSEAVVTFIEKIKEASLESDKLVHVWDLFQKASAGQGTNADDMLARLRDATSGLVNKLDLATYGSKILQSGIKSLTPERIQELTKATVELAEANGHSAKDAVDTLTLAFSRGARNAGFMLSRITGIPREVLQLANIPPMANLAERCTESLEHSIVVVWSQAEKLKPVPQTLEQSITRIKVLFTDMWQSFGVGINNSGGSQFFINTITNMVKSFGSLETIAQRAGEKIGQAFGLITFAVTAAAPPLEAIKTLMSDLVDFGAAMFAPLSDALTNLDSKGDGTVTTFEKLHPVMSTLAKIIIILDVEMTKLANSIDTVVKNIAGIAKIAGVAGLIGAVVGGIAGIPGGPAGVFAGALSGLTLGTQVGAATGATAAVLGGNALTTRGRTLGSNITGQYTIAELAAMGKSRSGGGVATLPWETGGVPTPNETAEQTITRRYQELAKAMASPGVGGGTGGSYTAALDDTTSLSQEQLRISAQAQAATSAAAKQKAFADAQNASRLQQIENQKDREQESYKNSEIGLEAHLNRMRELESQSYDEQISQQQNATYEKVTGYTAQKTKLEATAGLRGVDPDTLKLQIKSINDQIVAEMQEGQAAQTKLTIAFNKQMESYDAQSDADRLAARKKAISTELSLAQTAADSALEIQQKKIRASQALNEKLLGTGQLTPEEYQQKQLANIEALKNAEIGAANAIATAKGQAALKEYVTHPGTATGLSDLLASLSESGATFQKTKGVSEEGAIAAITALLEGGPEKSQQATQKKYEPQIGQLTQQLQFQQEHPEQATASTATLMQEILALQTQETKELQDQLAAAKDQPDIYQSLLVKIQAITAEFANWREKLLDALNIVIPIGSILSTAGTSIGSGFRSKFGQSVSQSLTSGARLTQNPQQLANILSAPVGQSGQPDQPGEGGTYTTPTDVISSVANKMAALGTAIDQVVTTMLNAKNALAGGLGGAAAGGGLGNSAGSALGSLFPSLGSSAGPIGVLGGALLGGAIGAITGNKNQQVTNQINQLNTTFTNLMNAFANNTNNLSNTIQQLQGLMAQAEAMQASSKKGSAQYQQAIDQYIQQITQLQTQQMQTVRQMNEQVAVLSMPIGAQTYLQTLQQILQQYQQFAGAAQTTTQLATANQFLTQSLQQYEQNLSSTLLQDNQQAIQDALQLNELTLQRQQMVLAYNQQIQSVLSSGVLTRQMTRAQSAGTQIEQMNITYQQQLDQINQEIAATTFKVQAESQIFQLAQTRIGLENQLTATQNAQTNLDMQRIVALQQVISQISSSNFGIGALGALLSSMQTITGLNGTQTILQILESLFTPGSGSATNTTIGTTILETAAGAAYQSRASMGFGAYRAQNL